MGRATKWVRRQLNPVRVASGKATASRSTFPPPYQVANTIPTTAAIVTVHSHPVAHSARGNTKRPITSRRSAISMMITISATTPLMTADQNSALIGSRADEIDENADQGEHRDGAIERFGIERLTVEAGGPAERLAERVGAGAARRPRPMIPAANSAKVKAPASAAAPRRPGGGLDVCKCRSRSMLPRC